MPRCEGCCCSAGVAGALGEVDIVRAVADRDVLWDESVGAADEPSARRGGFYPPPLFFAPFNSKRRIERRREYIAAPTPSAAKLLGSSPLHSVTIF